MGNKYIYCIHGNSSSSAVFKPLKRLASSDYKVVAPDLPGHGANQNHNGYDQFTVSKYCTFLLEDIKQLDGDVLLIGNSLGGHLAIEIARQIENLKGLIIMGTPPLRKPLNFEEAFNPLEALRTFLTESPSQNKVKEAFDVAVQQSSYIPTLINDFKRTNPQVRSTCATELASGALSDQFFQFTTLDKPRFIIAGVQDPSVNLDYLKKLKDKSQGFCELLEFDDCGHYPSVDRPNLFVETIQKIAHAVFE